jgi:hypothetical protein
MIELKNDCLHFTFPELRASLSRLFDAYEEDLLHRVYREDRRKAFESYRKRLGIKPRGFRPEGLDKVLRLGKAELGQAIRLAVAKVRPDRAPGCEIEFQRTLRLPDDGRTRFLPPGLGRFPLRHIDDYGARMPEKWLARGGVMMPMYQSEALWLKFRSVYPCAVKVGAGRIDALTGEEWAEGLRSHPQNYLTLPEQPWLDGFAMAPGVVRQFVATPLGGGSTVEEQITGAAEFGGIQLQAWPMRAATYFERIARPQLPESLADLLPDLLGRRGFHVLEERLSFCDAASVAEPAMGLGMGGLMRQQVYRDKLGPEAWDAERSSRCFVHLCDALRWSEFTGSRPPQRPLAHEDYETAGLPWFDHYRADLAALEGSPVFAGLRSVEGCRGRGDGTVLPAPGPLVQTTPKLGSGQVREW